MSDETNTTGEVARVLREHFDPTGTERNDPYAAAVYEEAAQALAEAGLLRDYAVNVHESCNRELGNALGDVEAFRDDLTALREGLMERIGRYTPSDADLLAYVDALKAQIATQEPAGATQGGSGGSRASGGLDGAAASPLDEVHEMFFGKDAP